MFETAEGEKEILDTLIGLNKSFASLMRKVRTAFDEKETSDSKLLIDITRWIEAYMNWSDKLTNASLDETFNIIHPFYDFIDCRLIVDMSEAFLQGFKFSDELNIVSVLQQYQEKADKLRFSAQVKHLNESLKKVYKKHMLDTSNMPMILMTLHNPWHANANPHLKTSFGSNAVMIASYDGSYEVVELLISKGVDYKCQRKDGVNAFMLACENGHAQIVKLLLEKLIDPNVQTKEGISAFMEQVDPNAKRNDGWNAFMLACKNGHTQIVEFLLKKQVDPNVQNKDGVTASMIASANGHYEVVRLLLEWKAPTIKSNEGCTTFKTGEMFRSTLVTIKQNEDSRSIPVYKNLMKEEHLLGFQKQTLPNRCDIITGKRIERTTTGSEASGSSGYFTGPGSDC
ncbi:PREDICTED: ankyrin repeat, SAM and basic leucine zipper domain-containing protein 1-like [Amphimedon queenslandica]|uniref:Uncharacterized protein n=1 Tax=Amphimedon queenslandica TaxID=400682 RepID=A0AAN0JRH7_AMPQE|nr:PREDICTED: ankyrin repeat, SAM and basic leucine zipper domain-containing protein 1-like [Amphimedon queenslandica]|eukprot:XP_019859683.1 PREDICTED: ankyrin repeat, SAM and basic leucine zipper domain-containing protein 1-like [Amphimedon queenslandica]